MKQFVSPVWIILSAIDRLPTMLTLSKNVDIPEIWLPLVANVTPIPGILNLVILELPSVISLLTLLADGFASNPSMILLLPDARLLLWPL